MSSQYSERLPYVLPPGSGQLMGWFNSTITVKASNSGIGVTEVVLHPGEEPPLHVHKNEDEWFYVLEGAASFHVGGQNYFGEAGAFVSFPRGIPHTFTIETSSARLLVLNTPGGFEHMFDLSPKTPEEVERAMAAFGMDVVGPHPRDAAAALASPHVAANAHV